MSRNFLRTFLALAALLTASVAPTLLPATSVAKIAPSHTSLGPGGGGGGGDPNPPCPDCAVRAL